MLRPNRSRIERALGLFSSGALDQPHSVVTSFECLGAEMLVRWAVSSEPPIVPSGASDETQLARLFRYASDRLTDILTRRSLIEWMRLQFAAMSGPDAAAWHSFGALCIKDFHADVASFMDAVAPTILQACGHYHAHGEVKLPGFADVQKSGSAKSPGFRSGLPAPVLACIDATDEWWPHVKAIRDTLTHREHDKIAFAGPAAGVLFQVYAPSFSPKVIDPAFLWPQGHNVADFGPYSAYILAEVLLFTEDLGEALAAHLGLSRAGLTKSFRAGDFSDLLAALRNMLDE